MQALERVMGTFYPLRDICPILLNSMSPSDKRFKIKSHSDLGAISLRAY